MSDQAVQGVREGEVLAGKFRVERVLGRGGMGVVVAAHHLQLDERVALKFLLPESLEHESVIARFAREGRASAKIRSEHVARVQDVGSLPNGAPYLVMEYLDGFDLAAHVAKEGPLPATEAIDYVLQACEAIAEAHALGIVHRDLKPPNLFLTRRADGSACVKVLDFGISKMTTELDIHQAATKTSGALGSPAYMSPEQMVSAANVGPATDIWALGVILFELLTGQHPFEAQSVSHMIVVISTEPPTRLRTKRPDLPAALEAVILRCLEKSPGARFASIAELARALSPLAPSSQLSVDRIMRIGAGQITGPSLPPPALASSHAVAPTELATPSPASEPQLAPTAYAPEMHRGAAPPSSQARPASSLRAPLAVGAVVALLGMLAGGAYLYRARSATPAPVVTIEAPKVDDSVTQPAPSAAPSASATAVQVLTPAATTTGKTPLKTARPAPPTRPAPSAAPAPAPNAAPVNDACSPPHFFDAQGNKHFKPECYPK